MKCQSCDNLLADGAQFCGTCGLPTSHHPSDATTQLDLDRQTNFNEARSTDDRHARHEDPRVGLVIDNKYKLIESLGQGGMGSVFRAQRLHIGDEVAVKLLHRDLVREQQALERFRREASTAAMIRHPNVVTIHDFGDGTHQSEAYIVMELVRGVSLGNLLRRDGRMLPDRAIPLMLDICAGVGTAHRQGLLHRDLKPDNVIIAPPGHEDDDETAKVVDFGLAKVRDVTAQTALTQTGAVIGTLYYMSPEQCSGEELDARADVYSLGAMLYEMLTGGPPFRSNNFAGLISKQLHEPPPHFPPSLGISPAIESVCLRALAKNREHRQPDAIAFARDLVNAQQAPVSFQPSVSVTTKRSPLRWIIAAAGVLVALVAIVGIGIAIQFGANRMQASREVATNVNQAVQQNSIPVDLRGTWAGTYGPMGSATKLTIKNQSGDDLDGVLEQGTVRVAFKGTYDAESRTLTMNQTELLSGSDWSLGHDVGQLSPDGKKITGTGKDEIGGSLGINYQWSFTRK